MHSRTDIFFLQLILITHCPNHSGSEVYLCKNYQFIYETNIYSQIIEEASESRETGTDSQQGEHHQGAHETTRTSVGIRLVSILAASWICNNDWLLCLLRFVLTD